MDMTIHKGRRMNTSSAYLRPVLYRSNLDTATNAVASRVLFNNKKAIGVEYSNDSGSQCHAIANKEVNILSIKMIHYQFIYST